MISGNAFSCARLHVDEVDVDPVDLGLELRQRVQSRFAPAPVVFVRPVAGELLQRRQLHTLRAIGDELLARPTSRLDAAAQFVELVLGNLDSERADVSGVTHGRGLLLVAVGSLTMRWWCRRGTCQDAKVHGCRRDSEERVRGTRRVWCAATISHHRRSRARGPTPRARAWAEPGLEGARQVGIVRVAGPDDVSVGTNQHGLGRRDFADDREHPRAVVFHRDDANVVGHIERRWPLEVQEHLERAVPAVRRRGWDRRWFAGRGRASANQRAGARRRHRHGRCSGC